MDPNQQPPSRAMLPRITVVVPFRDAANWLPGVYHVLRCNGSSCGAARWIRQ